MPALTANLELTTTIDVHYFNGSDGQLYEVFATDPDSWDAIAPRILKYFRVDYPTNEIL